MFAEVVENDDLDTFLRSLHVASLQLKNPIVREAEADATEEAEAAADEAATSPQSYSLLLYMYTYTVMIYVYLFWFQQEAWDFWGPIGREKFGRKELLLDFYIVFVVFELYGVLFHSVSSQVCFVNMWDDAPGDFWRWIVIRWCVVVELKLTNSTWRLIA